jgi:hypothetical protein
MSKDSVNRMCLARTSLSCKVAPDTLDVTEFLVTILEYRSVSQTQV